MSFYTIPTLGLSTPFDVDDMEELMSDHEEKEEINASLDEDDEPGPSNQVRMTTYTTDETPSSGKLIYILRILGSQIFAWFDTP